MAPKNGTHYTAIDPPPKPVITRFGKTRTRVSEQDSVDVNKIVARYEKTGVLPVEGREAFYADVSNMGDYRTALEQVRMADEAFMQLPAALRARFDNDAAAFLDFTSDPANRAEMAELGLIEPLESPADVPASPEPPVDVPEGPGGGPGS